MKAEELRIGNYLDWFGKIIQVEIIDSFSFVNHKPVRLTEEWLLKFGEIWDDDYRMFFNLENNHLYCDENLAECHRISWIKIKYVHQLQNLYFALTGKELKIITP